MSSIGVEIHYRLDEKKQELFSKAIESYSVSEKSEADASKYIQDLKDLGAYTEYTLSLEIYDFGFVDLGDSQYILHLDIWCADWEDIILPLLSQMGSNDIFAYAHDTSWGGDMFFIFGNGKAEMIYTSGNDPELDSFLYDNEGDYIGTSYDQLYNLYLKGKFTVSQSQKYDITKLVSDEEYEEAVVKIRNFPVLKGIVFVASLAYLICYFLYK